MREVNAPNCGRENDLIAFLYGELNDAETETFQRHLHECHLCRAELAAFRNVRESVVAWRNESLGGVIAPTLNADSVEAGGYRKQPSALVALREFFRLSPLWMKGAAVFGSLLFCLFAVLAVGHLRDTQPAPLATIPAGRTYSEQELTAIVERRVQDELQRIENSSQPSTTSPLTVKNTPQLSPVRRVASREFAADQKARRPLSKTERAQLAADLRLISAQNDNELDLLDDQINQ
jgi:anti-sigma factor RsiW